MSDEFINVLGKKKRDNECGDVLMYRTIVPSEYLRMTVSGP